MDERSKLLKFTRFRWGGVEVRAYKGPAAPFKDVTRQTLLGEAPGEEAFSFITRGRGARLISRQPTAEATEPPRG